MEDDPQKIMEYNLIIKIKKNLKRPIKKRLFSIPPKGGRQDCWLRLLNVDVVITQI
jgi:hypothetical protein